MYKIGYSLWISFMICMLIWGVVYQMVPPMMAAVPDCAWIGCAKVLVFLTEIIMKYPFLPLLYPCIIIGCYLFLYQNRTNFAKEDISKFSSVLDGISVVVLILIIAFVIMGTFDMQEQMIANMGLK